MLHLLAALALVVLALMKAVALVNNPPAGFLQSTVFPFMKNVVLYWASIVLDVAAAAICVKQRGRDGADFSLLLFAGLMLWYKSAVYFTGGSEQGSGCLGALTSFPGLTESQENDASLGVLILLVFCTLPRVSSAAADAFRLARRSTAVLSLLYLLGGSALGETVEIRGTYRYQNYNAETGKPFTNAIGGIRQWGEFTFEVLLTRKGFQISVTNSEDAGLWTQLVFDGTNMFTMAPYEPPFVLPGETRSNTIFATVSKGNLYLPYVGDWARAAIPWITYALRPSEARTNQSGLVDIPLPWETPRRKLLAYGWRWEIVPATDSRFIAYCRIVRDVRLDFPQSAELLRPEFNYPEDITAKNLRLASLRDRKQIRAGFVDTIYECKEWYKTNGLTLPVRSEFIRFLSGYQFPPMRATLTALKIHLRQEDLPLNLETGTLRVVQDYRYKRIGNGRIFRYGEYTLTPGQSWKGPNEPELLQQAEHHLKYGKKYRHYDYSFRLFSAWALGVVVLISPLVLAWVRSRNKQHQNTQRVP